jgi:hypothetical protein
MSAAKAGALTESHDQLVAGSYRDLGLGLPSTLYSQSWRLTPAVDKEWARSSIRIEAKLRAYFGSRESSNWQNYRQVIDFFLATVAGRAYGAQYGAISPLRARSSSSTTRSATTE